MNKGDNQLFVMVAGAFISDVDCKKTLPKRMGVGFLAHAPHYRLLTTTRVSYHNRDCPHY